MIEKQLEQQVVEDSALVERSQTGDLGAYNDLVLRYQRGVYNLCLRMLHDVGAAEDVCQEAFVSAWRNIDRFRGGNFSAWLLRIATNACYDQIRRRQRHPAHSLEAATNDDEAPLDVPDGAEAPDERMVRAELAESIVGGLAEVHPDQRIVIILVDIQGLSYEEAAVILDVPIGTVKSRLSRGRAQMRAYFSRHPEHLPDQYRFSS